jgi:hypothetical protein
MLNEAHTIFERLADADRAHQKEAAIRLLLSSAKYGCALILGAFVIDILLHLSSICRLALLLAMFAGALALAMAGWFIAFVRRNRIEYIARFLETRDPALGSRLINLIQLDQQVQDASLAPLTRDLARQAVENYTAQMRTVPIERLARTDEPSRLCRRAAWVFFSFAVVLAVAYRISAIEIARFADPFGNHPPYSLTHLEIVQPGPAGTNVLYGSGLIVKVKASGHQPREIFLTAFPPEHPKEAFTLPMFDDGGGGFNQSLDNIRTDLVVFAHTRDHDSESRQLRIGVVLTPQLRGSFVRTTPPSYTGIRPEEKAYEFKDLQVLEGTDVRFRLQSNRPLRDGVLEITAGDHALQHIRLTNSAENEVTGSFNASDSGRLRFGIVDVAGLPSPGDFEGALTVTHDLPPDVHISNPDHDAFAAMDFKLLAQIEASDDYGLREIRVYRGLNGVYSGPEVFRYNSVILDSRETVPFDFAHLGVQPGDLISIFAEAVDNAPQPHISRSQTVCVRVISLEDYNNYLRQQTDISDTEAKYSQLNDDLQNLIAQQKELGAEAQRLAGRLAGANSRQQEEVTQEFDRLIAKQNELNKKLNQQAARMENFVRQHPLYDVEQDLQSSLRTQAESIRASTRENDAAARDIAKRSSPPNGPRQLSPDLLEGLKAAADEQVARLGGARDQTGQQVVQVLDDMSQMQNLINDFNLFQSLYQAQQDLAQQAQAYNRPGQLDREDQLALKDMAATENEEAQTLYLLRQKLRDDAAAAEKLFPKAAQSGRDLSDQIGEHRLEPLANEATSQMLAGSGDQSFQLADRLRSEMAKLFSQCQGGNCPSHGELDTYLRLQRMSPGNNFAQMAVSRKFGFASGRGEAGGMGQGTMGTSGFAAADGSNLSVLGNESFAGNANSAARQSSRFGHGGAGTGRGDHGEPENPDVLTGLNPVNRRSAAVSSETAIEEYNEFVDSYFKSITTKNLKPSNEKSN